METRKPQVETMNCPIKLYSVIWKLDMANSEAGKGHLKLAISS